jgi:lipid A 3-O-deacylase PagL
MVDSVDSIGGVDGRLARPSTPHPRWAMVWAGGARHSRFRTRLGIRHRDFYMAGIRFAWQLPVSERLAVDYFIDLVPLIVSTNNPTGFHEPPCEPQGEMPVVCEDLIMETATTRGYGVSPIGLQLRVFPGSRIQPLLGLSLGAAWYDKPVPDPDETRLNFMGDLAAGVSIRAGLSGAVVLGIRQHHTSNANTGRVNPGIDSRVLYAGFTRTLGRRGQR